MATRYVVLVFEDGDRFDYDPPLLHDADNFLGRFAESSWMDTGAVRAYEIDGSGRRIGEDIAAYDGPDVVVRSPGSR